MLTLLFFFGVVGSEQSDAIDTSDARLGLEFLFNFDLVGEDVAMGDGVVPPLVVVTVRSLGDVGSRYLL